VQGQRDLSADMEKSRAAESSNSASLIERILVVVSGGGAERSNGRVFISAEPFLVSKGVGKDVHKDLQRF
jgi:hypothetical protein